MLLLAALLGEVSAEVPPETFKYRASEALVVDRSGKPLFRTSQAFLLTVSGNPQGQVLDYDAQRRMIRVSPNNAWWIPCDQLQPLPNSCQQIVDTKRKTRGIKLPPTNVDAGDSPAAGLLGRGVPSCPGDPRCPSGG